MSRLRSIAILAAAVFAAAPAWADEIGDVENGAEIWIFCSGCHELGPEAVHAIGPHLNGIFGRRAASHEGFDYSASLTRAGNDGLVWDLETLDAYIENPLILVSGTRMSFPGLEDKDERDDLMAFLRQFSDSPQNIPEAVPTARPSPPEVDLPPDILAIQGDRAYGEYLSSECKTCHQADGSYEGIPSITNWPTEQFVIAMHAYKRGIRINPVMQMMAGRLSDEEIAALAAYFETSN